MFSRLFNGSRAAGRGVARAGKRNFSSSASATASRRVAGFAAAAAIGAMGVTLMTNEFSKSQTAMCAGGAPTIERKNTAFVFIKPHAVTENTKSLVSDGLRAKGLTITKEGTLSAKQIDEGMLIDNHYYAIASKATILKPDQLNVPEEKFKGKFGLGWKDALAKGVVYNAADACTELGLDASGLNKEWAKAKKAGKLIKFGGGFYCGLIEIEGKKPMYVFNGFFMSMRSDYVKPGAEIHYYVVEWDSKKLAWEDFRGAVLGPTDPADAPADSMRGLIYSKWQALGLASQPNVGLNGVHASASPFEALAERMNWLGVSMKDDEFAQSLVSAGISEATIKEWSVDPVVTYGSDSLPIKKSLFDSLEDTDSDMCIAQAMMINGAKGGLDPVQLGGGFTLGAVLATVAAKML